MIRDHFELDFRPKRLRFFRDWRSEKEAASRQPVVGKDEGEGVDEMDEMDGMDGVDRVDGLWWPRPGRRLATARQAALALAVGWPICVSVSLWFN